THGFPANNLPEFIAYTKANQGRLQYGSGAGTGSGNHMSCEMLNAAIGGEGHSRALSRYRAADAGHDRRPDGLPVPAARNDDSIDPDQQGQRHRDAGKGAARGPSEPRERARAGPHGLRGAELVYGTSKRSEEHTSELQ